MLLSLYMTAKKQKVAVIMGGKSVEHDVSLLSAKNVVAALDAAKYDVTEILIDKKGAWSIPFENLKEFDVVFPVLHGQGGEDGTIQGLLTLLDVPFVGPGVEASAICMDKDVTKKLLGEAGIPVCKWVTLQKSDAIPSFEKVSAQLGMPMFVKPASLGSSVGVSKVEHEKEFEKAVELAFQFDTKIIIEEFVKGREIECAVLGNEKPEASVLGEVVTGGKFYSYDAKYNGEGNFGLEIPAKILGDVAKKIQEIACAAYKTIGCEGMSRVDFFLREDGSFVLNEINTIPGFTNVSMYPKLWEATGLSYSKLIDKLIELGIQRFNAIKKLKTSF